MPGTHRSLSGAVAIATFAVASVISAGVARGDAVLQSAAETVFPDAIDVAVHVRAQVEVTTVTLSFPPLTEGGDYVLTVPSPRGAYATGVDMDRGDGFIPLAMTDDPPPVGVGGSSGADLAVKQWRGNTPLVADMVELAPGALAVRVQFLRLLRRYQGEVTFDVGGQRCPLRDGVAPDPTLSVSITLDTLRPITALTASAPGDIVQQDPERAVVEIAPSPLTGHTSTTLTYAEALSDIAVHVLTHRTPTADPLGGEDGYFMLLVDADEVTVDTTKPRTLNLVIDSSGSMSGDKIAQARDAARAMLDNLRSSDEFNIIEFDGDVCSLWSEARRATQANIDDAREFIKDIEAGGGTNLDSAIVHALGNSTEPDEDRASQRFDAVVLLSDGQATAGVTNRTEIHRRSIAFNRWQARIYTVSIGFGADLPLMRALAVSSRGKSFFLNEDQATTELVTTSRTLFEDIYAVRLTDMEISLTGIDAADTLPENPPDLFNGGQVVIVGRYRTPGSGSVDITGDAAGATRTITEQVDAPALAEDDAFIKYLWATEKVGQLLAEMSMGGDEGALRERIIEIGLAYRIQTPFTSFSSAGVGGADAAFAASTAGCHIGLHGELTRGALVALCVFIGLFALLRRRQASLSGD